MRTKFHIDEIPQELTIFEYIKRNSAFVEAANDIKPQGPAPVIYEIPYLHLPEGLFSEVNTLLATHDKTWLARIGPTNKMSYVNLSLQGNNHPLDVADAHDHRQSYRWGYGDSLSFILPLGFSGPRLDEFFQQFSLLKFKCRLCHLPPQPKGRILVTSHNDSSIFEGIRLSVTTYSTPGLLLNIVDDDGSKTQMEYELGVAHWYNGGRHPHYPETMQDGASRTNIAINLSPWISYDELEQTYYLNRFFGKIHPIDMVMKGEIVHDFHRIPQRLADQHHGHATR